MSGGRDVTSLPNSFPAQKPSQKSVLDKIMSKILPPTCTVDTEAKELVKDCAQAFISSLTRAMIDKCTQEKRRTMTASDVVSSLKNLGFDDYITPTEMILAKLKERPSQSLGIKTVFNIPSVPNTYQQRNYSDKTDALPRYEQVFLSSSSSSKSTGNLKRTKQILDSGAAPDPRLLDEGELKKRKTQEQDNLSKLDNQIRTSMITSNKSSLPINEVMQLSKDYAIPLLKVLERKQIVANSINYKPTVSVLDSKALAKTSNKAYYLSKSNISGQSKSSITNAGVNSSLTIKSNFQRPLNNPQSIISASNLSGAVFPSAFPNQQSYSTVTPIPIQVGEPGLVPLPTSQSSRLIEGGLPLPLRAALPTLGEGEKQHSSAAGNSSQSGNMKDGNNYTSRES